MLSSAIPAKFGITWGSSAGPSFIRAIPAASQIGIQAGAASLTDGFPPVCFTPVGAGGTPPWGADFNGALSQITAWNQWQAAGGTVTVDSAFSTSIGGYPAGAILRSATSPTNFWMSLIDNNTNSPDSGSSGQGGGTGTWAPFGDGTGKIQWRPTSEVLPGWLIANATTMGSATSAGTQRANSDCQFLYCWLWNNFSNTQCPTNGGRGASAIADFNANKWITMLDMRGLQMLGMDTMQGSSTTLLTGVPVTSGSTTSPGSVLGENLHTLLTAELATHNHLVSGTTGGQSLDHTHTTTLQNSGVGQGLASGSGRIAVNSVTTATSGTSNDHTHGMFFNSGSSGSNTPHNTVSLSMTGTFYIHL